MSNVIKLLDYVQERRDHYATAYHFSQQGKYMKECTKYAEISKQMETFYNYQEMFFTECYNIGALIHLPEFCQEA